MTTVSYTARFTRNMGNYESLQLEIGVEDSLRGEEKVNDAYNRVKGFVDSKLIGEVEQLEEDIRKVHPA